MLWLPTETETVLVARSNGNVPIVVDGKAPPNGPDRNQSMDAGRTLEGLLWSISTRPFYELNGGANVPEFLAGQNVKFAVHGSCRFRGVPKGPVAVTVYAGCHILVFDRNLGENGDLLMKSLMDEADSIDNLAGHKVARFQRKINDNDTELFFVTRPKPNVLLIATDHGYLLDLLKRMARASTTLAFPERPAQWGQFPPNSRYWAVRCYGHDSQTGGIGSFIFTYTPNDATEIRLRQVASENASIETIAENARKTFLLGEGFGIAPPVEPSVRKLSSDVVEITLRIRDARVAFAFYVILYNALGHEFSI